jgi:hypothetical protein
MSTVRKSRVRVKPARTARLLPYHEPRCAGSLAIGIGKAEPTYYYAKPIPADFGELAVELEKFLTQRRGDDDEVYHVLLNGRESSCSCRGSVAHSQCKHLDSVRELYAAGELKAAPKVPRYRSTAEFMEKDPEGYNAMLAAFPARKWPPDDAAELERRYAGEECSCPLCGEPSDQGVHDSCAAEEQARADQE